MPERVLPAEPSALVLGQVVLLEGPLCLGKHRRHLHLRGEVRWPVPGGGGVSVETVVLVPREALTWYLVVLSIRGDSGVTW